MNSSSVLSLNNPKFLQSLDLTFDTLFTKSGFIIVQEKGEKQEPYIDGTFILYLLLNEFKQKLPSSASNPLELESTSSFSAAPTNSSSEKKVLLILTDQTEKHWTLCCGKLGQNLEIMKKAGNLTVIDTLKMTYDRLTTCTQTSDSEPLSPGKSILNYEELQSYCKTCIDSLYTNIPHGQSHSDHSDKNSSPKLLIIIENLTTLFYNNIQGKKSSQQSSSATKMTLEFLRYLRTYRCTELDISVATLLKSTHHEYPNYNNNNAHSNNVNYIANIITECYENITFQVCPLITGYSDQINGKLVVKDKQNVKKSSYQYKIEDRNVKFLSIIS